MTGRTLVERSLLVSLLARVDDVLCTAARYSLVCRLVRGVVDPFDTRASRLCDRVVATAERSAVHALFLSTPSGSIELRVSGLRSFQRLSDRLRGAWADSTVSSLRSDPDQDE